MSELWRMPASQLAKLVRDRAVSSTEVVMSALDRLEAANPRLNAVVDYRPEQAIAQARSVDRKLAGGDAPGILAGVPVTIKINIDQKGYATTNGVRAQKDRIATANSPVVDNLLRAGAVPIGRTNAPAFSCRWFTDNLLHGATINPRNRALTPGGSSGGAASAVAAGIGAIAHGSDIAGSIRYPAYACGVHGIRPTLGRVAAYNSSDPERRIGPQLMAVSGPIARTIDDVRLGLEAMSAPDPRDPWWVPAPLVGPHTRRVAAVCFRPDGMTIEPAVEAGLRDAAERLRDAGWTVDELDVLPPIRDLCDLQYVLWVGDGADAILRAAEDEGDEGAIVQYGKMIQQIGPVTIDRLSASLTRRATIKREWHLFLQRYPVVILPVSGEVPFLDHLDLQGPDANRRVWNAQMTMIGLAVTALPCLTVTTGMAGSMPVGVQLLAGPYREDLCLAAGQAIEARGAPLSIADGF